MALIGVPEQNLRYLNYLDGETHRSMAAVITDMKEILREIRPDIVYVPAFETGHVDHDTVHFSVWRALRELEHASVVYEFPLYNASNTSSLFPFTMRALPPGRSTVCRVLPEAEYRFVLKYWDVYESQQYPLGWYIALVDGKRRTLGIEYLRPLPEYSYTQKPFDGDIAYERFLKKSTFQQFKAAVSQNALVDH